MSFSAMLSRFLGRKPVEPSSYDMALARGREDIQLKTALQMSAFGLGEGGGGPWAADLDAGTITLETTRGFVLNAPVQVIGTLDTTNSSWLWGWDHPSVPEPQAEHARIVRDFGAAHGIDRLTTRMIEVNEGEAWDLAALALHLAGAQGAYRGPAGTTLVFMTYGTITVTRQGR